VAPASNGPVFKSLHISQEEPALGTSGSSVGASGGVLGITRRIQEVFRAVQERRLQDQVEPAANRTLEAVESVVAVIPLVSIFPFYIYKLIFQ